MIFKTVQSKNPCQSVIQTNYDIVQALGGELKVETADGKMTASTLLLKIL